MRIGARVSVTACSGKANEGDGGSNVTLEVPACTAHRNDGIVAMAAIRLDGRGPLVLSRLRTVERLHMAQSPGLRNFLLVVTVLGALLLMASAFPLRMSPMIFDSGENVTTWSVFIFLWLMPAALIAGIAIAWLGYARNARAIVVCGLALAAAPVLITAGILVMAGAV